MSSCWSSLLSPSVMPFQACCHTACSISALSGASLSSLSVSTQASDPRTSQSSLPVRDFEKKKKKKVCVSVSIQIFFLSKTIFLHFLYLEMNIQKYIFNIWNDIIYIKTIFFYNFLKKVKTIENSILKVCTISFKKFLFFFF